jgi:hypothetical protein
MKRIALLLVAVAMTVGGVAAWAHTSGRTNAQLAPQSTAEPAPRSAKDVRGASPYAEIKNEPPPRLFVDDPLPEGLAQGIVWIQWRVENLQVVPVFGKGSVNTSPRVGHLHVHVDDVGWWWADPSGINTIDIAGLSEGPHKVRLELVNANHEPFPGQSKTVTFTIPKGASLSLSHRHSR